MSIFAQMIFNIHWTFSSHMWNWTLSFSKNYLFPWNTSLFEMQWFELSKICQIVLTEIIFFSTFELKTLLFGLLLLDVDKHFSGTNFKTHLADFLKLGIEIKTILTCHALFKHWEKENISNNAYENRNQFMNRIQTLVYSH